MAVYDDDAVAANAWRHFQMAARHADQNEIPDAAQRLSNAIDEGAKWFVSRYLPDINRPLRGTHGWSFSFVAGHAALIETSAHASDALGARYPQEFGQDEPDIMRAVKERIEKASSLLAEGQWAVVREATDLLRRRILALGKNRDAAIYVDPGLGKGPNDNNAEQVRLAVRWVRRVFQKWRMPGG